MIIIAKFLLQLTQVMHVIISQITLHEYLLQSTITLSEEYLTCILWQENANLYERKVTPSIT